MEITDMVGRVFGLLTVTGRDGSVYRGTRAHPESTWKCQCACGVEIVAMRSRLLDGRKRYCSVGNHRTEHARACALAARSRADAARLRPVAGETPVYAAHRQAHLAWHGLRGRCRGSRAYAKRGVSVCARWEGSFEAFLEDMGDCPGPGYSVDRIDTFGNYEPGNCRWATRTEQARNTRRTVWVEWRGERRKLVEVCEEAGAPLRRVRARLRLGWPLEKALFPHPAVAS